MCITSFIKKMLAQWGDDRPDTVRRVSKEELLGRADHIATRLGVTRKQAFAMFEAGELEGTSAGTELEVIKDMFGDHYTSVRFL